MGAWSESPSGNDAALEWLANSVEYPIVAAIKNTIDFFLADTSDDVRKSEAEVAVALLLDLANLTGMKYIQLNIELIASEQNLWDIAIRAINSLLSEKTWLAGWSDPEKKANVLKLLLAELENLKDRAASK